MRLWERCSSNFCSCFQRLTSEQKCAGHLAQHTFVQKLNAENMNKSLMYTVPTDTYIKHLFMFPTLEGKWGGVLLLRLLGVRHLLDALPTLGHSKLRGRIPWIGDSLRGCRHHARATRSRCRGRPGEKANER